MKRYWEQLRPLERRWAVAGGCMVFLMLNYFFVWPHFHDWSRDKARIANAETKMATYSKELALKTVYETKLRMLQSGGEKVLPEDQAIDFVHFYSSRMYSNQVLLLNGGTLTTRTNQFFMEQQLGIQVQAYETNLVNFLYSLAAGNSMVRVRAMNLHPAPGQQQLNAGITMVASYQKKAPARAATPAVTPVKNLVPTAKPPVSAPAPVPAPAQNMPPGARPPMQTNKFSTPFSRPAATNKPGPLNFK